MKQVIIASLCKSEQYIYVNDQLVYKDASYARAEARSVRNMYITMNINILSIITGLNRYLFCVKVSVSIPSEQDPHYAIKYPESRVCPSGQCL